MDAMRDERESLGDLASSLYISSKAACQSSGSGVGPKTVSVFTGVFLPYLTRILSCMLGLLCIHTGVFSPPPSSLKPLLIKATCLCRPFAFSMTVERCSLLAQRMSFPAPEHLHTLPKRLLDIFSSMKQTISSSVNHTNGIKKNERTTR
jgi:hypothetical protein